jgi:membrane associated rhomboid family serine protease
MRRLLTSVPATIALIGVLLVGGVLALISPGFGREIIRATATGYAPFIRFDRWWSPLTYFLSTDNLAELLVALPVVAVCVGFAERRLGTARMIGSAVAAVAAGALVGIAIQELGVLGGEMWSRDVAEFQVVDPFAFVVAALMTATAYTGSIWRSRIRVFTIAVCGVYLLYSGQPSDLYRLLAALGGLGLGMVSHRPSGKRRWDRSTHHEVRVLAATMVAITATGPLLTLLSGRRYGLLAPLGLLMSGASAEGGGLTTACDPLSVSDACVRDITLSRLDSAGPAILTLLPLVLLLAAEGSGSDCPADAVWPRGSQSDSTRAWSSLAPTTTGSCLSSPSNERFRSTGTGTGKRLYRSAEQSSFPFFSRCSLPVICVIFRSTPRRVGCRPSFAMSSFRESRSPDCMSAAAGCSTHNSRTACRSVISSPTFPNDSSL